ncbi:MAG: GntR family transcriptional regulator [Bacteroidota bacterium]
MKDSNYIEINKSSKMPRYRQVIRSVINGIKAGKLQLGDKIPSINALSERYDLSRDTVEKAYSQLKERNIIVSVRGKGYYIAKTDLSIQISVLFLINKLSSYKMRIFNAFVKQLGKNAKVDLDIYHCEPSIFINTLNKKKDQYDFFVVMPHFRNENFKHVGCPPDILKLLQQLPEHKLIIMDRNIDRLPSKVSRIYQDFKLDIFNALSNYLSQIQQYQKIILIFPSKSFYPYPEAIIIGFKYFCSTCNLCYEVLEQFKEDSTPELHALYIVIAESDLVNLVKQTRDRAYNMGQDIGIISYNDTPLKSLLGITVISTDFKTMGITAANAILEKETKIIKNDFHLIQRLSA